MEQIMQVASTYGVTTAICAYMFWRDREREKERREDTQKREEREASLEKERIEATKENTQILSKLATLIETMVK